MNPFFFSRQFPKLVGTNVDERLKMPVVCAGAEEDLVILEKHVFDMPRDGVKILTGQALRRPHVGCTAVPSAGRDRWPLTCHRSLCCNRWKVTPTTSYCKDADTFLTQSSQNRRRTVSRVRWKPGGLRTGLCCRGGTVSWCSGGPSGPQQPL